MTGAHHSRTNASVVNEEIAPMNERNSPLCAPKQRPCASVGVPAWSRGAPRARRPQSRVSGIVAVVACLVVGLASFGSSFAVAAEPGFGITAFDGLISGPAGLPFTQAGGHPFTYRTDFDFQTFTDPSTGGLQEPVEDVKDIGSDLPAGFVGSTAGIEQCTLAELAVGEGATTVLPECPSASQIGVMRIRTDLTEFVPVPIFNMVPPATVPARFGFNVGGNLIMLDTEVLPSEGDYHLRTGNVDAPQAFAINGLHFEFWGVPSDPAHDSERNCVGEVYPALGGPHCSFSGVKYQEGEPAPPASATFTPFFRTPTRCDGQPLTFRLHADSWVHPETFDHASFRSHAGPGYPEPPEKWGPEVTNLHCASVPFEPTLSARPINTHADSPTGLSVELGIPRSCWDPKASVAEVEAAICQSDLKEASVLLPQGVSLNPSAADGLEACSPADAGVTSPLGAARTEFNEAAVTCPDASKIGSVEITTPLLDEPIPGNVYLAQQGTNPFNSLVAMYWVAEGQGVRIKQAGEVSLGPGGQITTTFDQVPQQPFSEFKLELYGGQRATLRTPPACGSYATTATLTPWSGTGAVSRQSSFQITEGCGGGFAPGFSAGTRNPLAGSYSPFNLRVSREDGSQELGSLAVSLPPGLVGALKGIPYCPDATLAAISEAAGTGASQIASPSCPAASQIGTTTTGAGAGTTPFYTSAGRVYLAGPYRGAPVSIAVVTPAVAGPFDLGTVVVRNAVNVNPLTAQISVASDPFPTVLHGVPLDLRDVRVNLDRPGFTLNATSCEPASIGSTITSAGDLKASPSVHYQASGCERLGFKPELKLSLKGKTGRTGHPSVSAVVTYPKKGEYANIASAQVSLPHGEFLDQGNLNKVCTQPQLNSQSCPAKSIYGHAKVWSPLLDKPLEGNVYLAVGFGYKLPALVAELDGQIRVLLVGKVDTGRNGGIRNTFQAVPDAPVERFELTLKGGPKYGLLENSEDICKKPQHANAAFTAQNGKELTVTPLIANSCGKGKKKGHKKHGGHARHAG